MKWCQVREREQDSRRAVLQVRRGIIGAAQMQVRELAKIHLRLRGLRDRRCTSRGIFARLARARCCERREEYMGAL